MPRENLNDLLAFIAVAREKSFTKAAAQLNISQSALSHTIRGLESRMEMRLLTRTTRSVSPTQAGERLVNVLGPHFEDIQAEHLLEHRTERALRGFILRECRRDGIEGEYTPR